MEQDVVNRLMLVSAEAERLRIENATLKVEYQTAVADFKKERQMMMDQMHAQEIQIHELNAQLVTATDKLVKILEKHTATQRAFYDEQHEKLLEHTETVASLLQQSHQQLSEGIANVQVAVKGIVLTSGLTALSSLLSLEKTQRAGILEEARSAYETVAQMAGSAKSLLVPRSFFDKIGSGVTLKGNVATNNAPDGYCAARVGPPLTIHNTTVIFETVSSPGLAQGNVIVGLMDADLPAFHRSTDWKRSAFVWTSAQDGTYGVHGAIRTMSETTPKNWHVVGCRLMLSVDFVHKRLLIIVSRSGGNDGKFEYDISALPLEEGKIHAAASLGPNQSIAVVTL